MARPIRPGLDYFPFDVDFFNDDKIAAVFVQFGIKGEIAAVKLLCAIYRNGYYIEWRETVRIKLLADLPGISEPLLDQIVKCLVKWDFFDKHLFFTANILTSRGIQKRYFAIASRNRRKVDPEGMPYLLPLEPQPYTPTEDELPKDNYRDPRQDENEKAFKEQMLASPLWLEQMRMRHHLTKEMLEKQIDAFFADCICRAKTHEDAQDAKRHLNDWLLKQEQLKRTEQNQNVARNRRQPNHAVSEATEFTDTF